MTKFLRYMLCLAAGVCLSLSLWAQKDSTRHLVTVDSLIKAAPPIRDKKVADSLKHLFTPKGATWRSAVLPGWGQVYVYHDLPISNFRKYWRLPVIYGALGITGAVFFYNLHTYRDLRFAYAAMYKASQPGAKAADSVDYFKIKSPYEQFSTNSIRSYRDQFRSSIDYSALFFLIMWGLNVVDATVDAHLRTFDINPDLSFRFKLGPSQFAGTTGVSLVLLFK